MRDIRDLLSGSPLLERIVFGYVSAHVYHEPVYREEKRMRYYSYVRGKELPNGHLTAADLKDSQQGREEFDPVKALPNFLDEGGRIAILVRV